jgi:hypothetical protein
MFESDKKNVPSSQIKKVFGPKVSKNGYRYDKKVHVDIAKNIFESYTKVTRKSKVINGQINNSLRKV